MARDQTGDDPAYVEAGIGENLDAVLVFNVSRTHGYLAPFLDAELRRERLTSAQLNTLLVLRTASDEGLLMGEIGRRLVVTKSNVTGLIDRLERRGLVERTDHEDRRATVVKLTEAGADLVERTIPRRAELIGELTGCLEPEEKRTLVRLLTKLRRELRRRRGSSCGDGTKARRDPGGGGGSE